MRGVELPIVKPRLLLDYARRPRGEKPRAKRSVRVLSFQTLMPACFSTALEDLAGRSVALMLSFRTSRPACFSTALEDLAGRSLANYDLRSKTSREERRYRESRAKRSVRVLSFQTSSPACFSTSLEDLAGAGLDNVTSLEDLAGGRHVDDNLGG